MSKLIIIRGNSGSGKTSAAKALQNKLGSSALMIPQDTVRRELLCAGHGKDAVALPLFITLLNYGNTHCDYVILEGILNANRCKPLFEAALEIFKNNIFAYYYDISFEETVKRHATKDKKSEFGEADMRRWWNEKDFIGIIQEKIFKEDVSLEKAIDIICEDILS